MPVIRPVHYSRSDRTSARVRSGNCGTGCRGGFRFFSPLPLRALVSTQSRGIWLCPLAPASGRGDGERQRPEMCRDQCLAGEGVGVRGMSRNQERSDSLCRREFPLIRPKRPPSPPGEKIKDIDPPFIHRGSVFRENHLRDVVSPASADFCTDSNNRNRSRGAPKACLASRSTTPEPRRSGRDKNRADDSSRSNAPLGENLYE